LLNPALGLGPGGGQLGEEPRLVFDDLHAPTATPAGSLDDDGQPDALHRLLRLSIGFDDERAWDHRNACRLHRLARGNLVAHQAHQLGLGPNPMQAALLYDFGELGIFGQKPVPWMDGVGAGHLGCTDQGGNVVVALARRGRANAHLLIREAHVERVRVSSGMHRDRSDSHVATGANHA